MCIGDEVSGVLNDFVNYWFYHILMHSNAITDLRKIFQFLTQGLERALPSARLKVIWFSLTMP